MAGKSIHYDLLTNIRDHIVGIGLDFAGKALLPDAVKLRFLPRIREAVDVLPMVCVCPVGSEQLPGGVVGQDDFGYPCGVVIVAKAGDSANANMEDLLAMRGLIMDHFINQRSATHQVAGAVQQPMNVDVRTDIIIDPNLFNSDYLYSGILLLPRVRKSRGQGKG